MASHWRKGYRRKDGKWVKPHRVGGKNPAQGCSWMVGMTGLLVAAAVVRRRGGRRDAGRA